MSVLSVNEFKQLDLLVFGRRSGGCPVCAGNSLGKKLANSLQDANVCPSDEPLPAAPVNGNSGAKERLPKM